MYFLSLDIIGIFPLYSPLWEALLIFHLARGIPFNIRSLEESCPTHRSVSPYVHMFGPFTFAFHTWEVGGWPLTVTNTMHRVHNIIFRMGK